MEFNIRTDEEWIAAYDKNLPEFQWFIVENFKPILLEKLKRARINLEIGEMQVLLTEIWFHLPDNKFNIIENPKGWNEFLDLIED